MGTTLILGLSVLFQLGTAALALWLIRITGRRLAWMLIATGATLVAVRRVITLFRFESGELPHSPDLSAELVILVISATMLTGVALIVPMFLTGRKPAEEVLRESEKRFRDIAENASEWIWEVDADGKYTYVSPAGERILGYRPEEVLNKHFYDLFHPEDREELKKAAFEVFAQKQSFRDFINRNMHKDGHTVWLSTSGVPMLDEGGNLLGYRGADIDITERKQAEERLQLLSSAVEQSTEGIAVVDLEGNLLFLNDAFASIHGYAPEELIGKHLSLFHTPEQLSALEAANRRTQKTGESSGEIWHVRRDGTVFPTLRHSSLLRDDAGNPIGMIGTLRDITQRKQEEQELLEAKQRLQHLLASNPSVIYSCGTGPDYATTFISENVSRQFGYEPQEFYEDTSFWAQRIHPDDADRVLRELPRIEKGDRISYEYRFRHKDGHFLWLHDELTPSKDTDGGVRGIVGSWFDITDRKRAEEALRQAHDDLEQRVEQRTADLTAVNQRLRDEIAERKRVEAALRESENRYHTLVDTLPQNIFQKDRDSVYVTCNESFALALGITPNEFPGKTDYDFFPKELSDKYRADDQRVIESGETIEFDEEYVEDGEPRIVHTVKTPVRDETGNSTGVLGIFWDVTERKRVEEELRESEERLRTVVGASKDAMIAIGENGLVTLFNPAAERMFGRSARQMLGQSLDCLIPEEYRDRHSHYIEGYFCHGEPHEAIGKTVKLPAVRSDGQEFPIELSLSIGQRGGQQFALAVIRDITERMRAEEAMVTRLRYEEGLAECSRAILVDTDREEALADTLQHLLRASSVSRVYIFENFSNPTEGLCMRQTHEACAAGVGPEIDNPLLRHLPYRDGFARWQEKLSKGEPVGGVVRDFPRDERDVLEPQDILSILVLPIFLEGNWYGFIGFDDTRTPRGWTEEDIRLLQTAAEMIGAFIARGRAEERLRQAKEAAEAANRAKSAFLANTSHEVRTPLTAMLGAAESLASTAGSPPEPERVDMILRNGRHLLTLIDDLLDLSRAEAGKLEVKRVDCSLLDVMADVQAVAQPLHDRETVDFRILYDTAIPARIHTDSTRLKQAVINLIGNALKFTQTGHVWVCIGVDRDRAEPRLTIAVEDTGVGIPAGDTERIFETFTQIGPGAPGISGGVGLGLPLTRWIAEQLGGTVEVTSVENRGSTFTLRVATGPLEDVVWITPDETSVPPKPTAEFKGVTDKPRLCGHVLLAEDYADTRKLIEQALISSGATVTAVDNGEDALKAAQAQSFDLILMDVRMPGMDGISATAELRRRGCLTPIIALTASTTRDDRDRIIVAGFDDLWSKPISLEHLIEAAAAYLATEPDRDGNTDTGRPLHSTVPASNPRLAAAVAAFIGRLPSRLAAVKAAMAAGSLDKAREVLHQLIGSGGVHGFMPISHESARLLAMAKDGTLAGRPQELHALEELVKRATDSLSNDQGVAPPLPPRPAPTSGPS
ncbi:MAG: PAS domain S-box protein [Phycisphaerae bacterium]